MQPPENRQVHAHDFYVGVLVFRKTFQNRDPVGSVILKHVRSEHRRPSIGMLCHELTAAQLVERRKRLGYFGRCERSFLFNASSAKASISL